MKNKIILKCLVGSLSDFEWKSLLSGLSEDASRNRRFIDLLKSFRKYRDGPVAEDLKERRNIDDVDSKLAARLISRVFKTIITADKSDFVKTGFSGVYLERLYITKLIYLLQLLSGKTLPLEWLAELVDSGIRICETFEFLEEKITLSKKRIEISLRLGRQDRADQSELDFMRDVNLLCCLTTMESLVHRYIDPFQLDSVCDPQVLPHLLHAEELSATYTADSDLKHLEYYNRLFKIRIALFHGDLILADKLITGLIEYCNATNALSYGSVISRNRYLKVIVCLLGGDFGSACMHARQARGISSGDLMEYNKAGELEAVSLLCKGEFTDAMQLLKQMLLCGAAGNTRLQYSKRHLLLAYACFQDGDWRNAINLLQHTALIEKVDVCWNVSVRLLNICLLIYSGRYDVADARIESLRKFLQRKSVSGRFTARMHVIFRLLHRLSFFGYDMEAFMSSAPVEYFTLCNGGLDLKWIPGGFEVIPFERLLNSHLLVRITARSDRLAIKGCGVSVVDGK